jgi:hypothetical protein
VNPRAKSQRKCDPLLPLVFEDVEATVVVGDVEDALEIHEDVAGLDLLLARGTWVEHPLRRRRHIERHLIPHCNEQVDIESVPVVPQKGHVVHYSLRLPHMEDYREIEPLSALAAL